MPRTAVDVTDVSTGTGTMRACGSFLTAGVLGCAAIACGGAHPEPEDQPPNAVLVSDSAGITNIALGRVEELSLPVLEANLVFSTRELGVELFWVGDALVLGNGGLALANTGSGEVLLFSADGSLTARVGGQGEGPGEFSDVTALLGTDGG
ncbi:MAG: hypothetical protein F4208_05305, partial [Gemmatimonadales bacterium]|nr:hypothetical protein [Gemmatimonadales bacterium]